MFSMPLLLLCLTVIRERESTHLLQGVANFGAFFQPLLFGRDDVTDFGQKIIVFAEPTDLAEVQVSGGRSSRRT